jgi:alpha-tubulin suppressor-like RCC1 family protein
MTPWSYRRCFVGRPQVWSWGRGDDGRLGHSDCSWKYVPKLVRALSGKHIVHVTCGSYHTAATSASGELFTFGGGMYGA